MNIIRISFFTFIIVLSVAESAMANNGTGSITWLGSIMIPIMVILFSVIGGAYAIREVLKEEKWYNSIILKIFIVFFFICIAHIDPGAGIVVVIIFSIFAIIRGVKMVMWGSGVRSFSNSEKPDHLVNANPWRLIPAGTLLILITLLLMGAQWTSWNEPYHQPMFYCRQAERDANAVASAIADYFSMPSHITTPTFNQLKNWTSVTLYENNTATITGANPNISITITVTDASGRCPKDYQAAWADWDGNNVYTVNITQ